MAQYPGQQNPWLALDPMGQGLIPGTGPILTDQQPLVPPAPSQMKPMMPKASTSNQAVQGLLNLEQYGDSQKYAPLLAGLDQNRQVATEQQRQGISEYEQLLKDHLARKGQQGMDLSPLLALSDTWFGGKLAQTYKRPEDSRTQLETTAALQQGLQKARGALTDDEQNYIASRAGLLQKADETKLKALEAAARIKESGERTSAMTGLKTDKDSIRSRENFNKEFGQPMLKMGEFVSAASDVKNILRSNNNQVPPINSPEYAKYQAAVSQMITRYNADVAKLGALAGADLKLLSGATVTSPDMFKTWFDEQLRGGAGSTIEVLDGLERSVDRTIDDYGIQSADIWGETVAKQYDNTKNMYQKRKQGSYGPSKDNKPQTVIQNGVTYILNPQTGEYE